MKYKKFPVHNSWFSNNSGERIGFKFIPSQSELFRFIPIFVSEPMRIIQNNVLYLVWWKTVKNQSDLIQLIPRYQSERIRNKVFNPISDWSKPNFQSESIRIIPTLDSFRLILIENSV